MLTAWRGYVVSSRMEKLGWRSPLLSSAMNASPDLPACRTAGVHPLAVRRLPPCSAIISRALWGGLRLPQIYLTG